MINPPPRFNLRERLTSDLLLLLAALIWGVGFVAQRLSSFHLGFFGFNGLRFLMGGLVILPFVVKPLIRSGKRLLWVVLAGVILFAASALQQAGIETTSAGSAGFITGVYVVLVPLLLALFWRQPSSPATWIAAAIALAGFYLLSTGGEKLNPAAGDLLVLGGSFVWALHVIVVGMAVQKMDVFAFSAGQFLVCAFLHLIFSLLTEPVTAAALKASWLPLLYAGLFSAAGGFTLQALGQRKAPASDAALLLSLEAVFAAIAGVLFLREQMNWIQITGCAIILAAILFSQLMVTRRNLKEQSHTPGG